MTNNTRISGPVDVLAVLDRLIGNARTMAGMTGDPVMRDNLRDGEKARAAVAELIEAAVKFRAAQKAVESGATLRKYRRRDSAGTQLDIALARADGAK